MIIKKWKDFLNESNITTKMIGYHSSDDSNLETSTEPINLGEDDYAEWFESVIGVLNDSMVLDSNIKQEVEDIMEDIENGELYFGFNEEDNEIVKTLFQKYQVCGIWVNKYECDSRWGEYCYSVHLNNNSGIRPIQDFILLEEEGIEDAYLYVYLGDKDSLKFKKL